MCVKNVVLKNLIVQSEDNFHQVNKHENAFAAVLAFSEALYFSFYIVFAMFFLLFFFPRSLLLHVLHGAGVVQVHFKSSCSSMKVRFDERIVAATKLSTNCDTGLC